MAMKQQVITECDWPAHGGLHGEDDNVTTVEFGIDGTPLEIDLCDGQATELRELLADYVTHARKKAKVATAAAPTPAKPRGHAAKEARQKREYYGKVRAWANQQLTADGQPRFTVSDRGQVAVEIRDAYDRAIAEQPEVAQPEPAALDEHHHNPVREPAFSGV
jgi:Lsr2